VYVCVQVGIDSSWLRSTAEALHAEIIALQVQYTNVVVLTEELQEKLRNNESQRVDDAQRIQSLYQQVVTCVMKFASYAVCSVLARLRG
jgi:tRNA U34 5-carboxymethylaminomethyl modifying enzyme MnmG/GidA